MAAPPVAYRTNNAQQYTGSFPPTIYYRDTYGLQGNYERKFTESTTTEASDDTVTTKSTVRTTRNIHQPAAMMESQTSKGTVMTQSYHLEQMITNRLLLIHSRPLFILTLISMGASIQLLIFAIICLFYDGSPYNIALIAAIFFTLNTCLILYFIKRRTMEYMLIVCCVTTSICFIASVALFFWTAYLVYGEDKQIRGAGWHFAQANLLNSNRIVTNTRVAMYSLHMILTPIYATTSAIILYILFKNLRSISDGQVTKGYFISQPNLGHQTVLVPIELKQVRKLEDDEPDIASIGVQTSGNQSHLNWS
ncbi:hypothetical protein QR680_002657 [Steinernema hermaphroditum]|uniref:Uncharacterized protein n=1 Tax=Steinernema hermaphroditum TaxID=289476 RepID=A0AA39H3K4_9BILA|nr:hypothetical protein QR680_002657 [Steinernema hermaphroditum]